MTLVQEIAVYLDMDEKLVQQNLIKLTLTDLVQLIQSIRDDDKETAFKLISGAAV